MPLNQAPEGGIQLIVANDAVGLDAARSRGSPSLGLQSMKERVQLFGDTLEIDSAPAGGATVLAWVPRT